MCGWGPGYEYVEKLARLRDIVQKESENQKKEEGKLNSSKFKV